MDRCPEHTLKPCPIDGGKAEWRQHPIGGTGSSGMEAPDLSIRCTVCGLQTTRERTEKWERGKGTYSIKAEAEAKLISRWNTRSTDTPVCAPTDLSPAMIEAGKRTMRTLCLTNEALWDDALHRIWQTMNYAALSSIPEPLKGSKT